VIGNRRGYLRVTGAGFGCLLIFLLPFCAVGIGALVVALRALAMGEWATAGFAGIFALSFGGAGFGVLTAAVLGKKATVHTANLREQNPDRPWLWRDDWASGSVRDSNRGTTIAAWVFALFWNLISLPAGFFAVRTAMAEQQYGVLFALIFPVIGAGLLVWAIRATTRYFKFGVSVLELTTRPGIVNGKLAGMVRIPGDLLPPEGFRVVLSSVNRRTTGSGKNRSTSETTLWQDEAVFHPARQATGTVVPVGFVLPGDVQPTDATDPDNAIVWRLVLSAEVPGVDYVSRFEVPVFHTELGEVSGPLIEIPSPAPPDLQHYKQPENSRIQVTTNRRGTEVVFPPARTPGPALFTTGFLLVWSGATYAMLRLGAPLLFPIVFGAFDVLLLYGVLALWLGKVTVIADTGLLTIERRILGFGGARRVEGQVISVIEPAIGMQVGSTPYYDIKVILSEGRPVTIGGGIRDRREAQYVAALLLAAVKGEHH
ncbi:MAG: hypothetical protein ABI836_02580, partial [Gemmatimonadota bacterium]